MSTQRIRIKRLAPEATIPRYETPEAAGLDLAALEGVTLEPGEWARVPTGLSLEIPSGFEGQVRPRSGLAVRHGVTVLNAPGTIDSDYRGEVQVALINLGPRSFEIEAGDRIAQLIIAPVTRVEVLEVSELTATERGSGGFGSTGR